MFLKGYLQMGPLLTLMMKNFNIARYTMYDLGKECSAGSDNYAQQVQLEVVPKHCSGLD